MLGRTHLKCPVDGQSTYNGSKTFASYLHYEGGSLSFYKVEFSHNQFTFLRLHAFTKLYLSRVPYTKANISLGNYPDLNLS